MYRTAVVGYTILRYYRRRRRYHSNVRCAHLNNSCKLCNLVTRIVMFYVVLFFLPRKVYRVNNIEFAQKTSLNNHLSICILWSDVVTISVVRRTYYLRIFRGHQNITYLDFIDMR